MDEELGYNAGGYRRRPITEVGRIVHNGFIDEKGIEVIKSRAKKGNTLYPGPVDNQVFIIFPREVCLENMDPAWPKQNDAPYVLSVANGSFRKNQSVAEVTEQMRFRGFAGGQGARYTDGENQENQLALVIGGSMTVRNTGPKRIDNGDRVMWQIPDPKDPYERYSPQSERMPYQLVPFNPIFDKLTAQSLVRILTQNPVMPPSEQKYKTPLIEGAHNLRQTVLQIQLEGIHTILTSGLVKLDLEAFKSSSRRKRRENASQYQNPDIRKEVLKRLSEHLGLREFTLKDKDKFTFIPDFGSGKEMTLAEAMLDVFAARTPNSLMIPMQGKSLTGDCRSALIRNQKQVLENLFSAINSANYFTESRIVGMANTPADPGQEFDILIGSKI